ncbi:MAG: amidohydrolase [Armatimonadetes bacterium]|nr:amidohydrolase [Armatimonadota bacterium]
MVIDAHAHVSWPGGTSSEETSWALDQAQIDAGDALGIDVFVCSCLAPRPSTPESFRAANDRMLAAIQRWPGRVWGYCYVNPGYSREALAEIERCLAHDDVVGVKLYNEYFFDDPVLRPVIEKCIELDVPILEHQGRCTDPLPGQPYISDAGHMARVAREYPEAKLIVGHIGGGGDWEWVIKATAEAPTLYADTSGSVVDEGLIEAAVARIGADRLLFACDGSHSAGVGKLRGARISEADRQAIASGNFLRLLGRSVA